MAVVAAIVAALGGWSLGVAAVRRDTAYLAPVFSPDGRAIVVVRREVTAVVQEIEHQVFSVPATGRVSHDQWSLVSIRIADGALTVVETFPPTPLEGTVVTSPDRDDILGFAHAQLRWADASHLDYELVVLGIEGMFVTRKVWNPATGASAVTGPWIERPAGILSDGEDQLSGDLEVIAPPGDEGMGCAVVLVNHASSAAQVLAETDACREKYPDGYTAAVIARLSRRAAIERAELARRTYEDLVARGRRIGLTEGQAMIDAYGEVNRMGLYLKTRMLAATQRDCGGTSPMVEIADAQFDAGLFSDIERAIALTGTNVPKAPGPYVRHRDDTTSRQIDAHLDAGNRTFSIRARGTCWEMWVEE